MDDGQARAMRNLTKRHEDAVRENAERMQRLIGYVMTRLDDGLPVSHFAASIAGDAQDIVRCLAVLDALSEATDILAPKEAEPVKPCGCLSFGEDCDKCRIHPVTVED